MDTETLQDMLSNLIEESADDCDNCDWFETVESVRTFDRAGLMTRDDGLVLTFDDGSEFQISIVRSR